MRRRGGFTLIEILAALMVLAIGLTAVVGLSLGSTSTAQLTESRNNAAQILSEAIADIERVHRITQGIVDQQHAGDVGLLLETLPSPNPNIHDSFYSGAPVAAGRIFQNQLDLLKTFPAPLSQDAHICSWPFGNDPKYCGGFLLPNGNPQSPPPPSLRDPTYHTANSNAYRVIYRLERHPQWQPHNTDGTVYQAEDSNSPFAGVYVLTLTVYKDVGYRGAKLEQISDPMVVYLRDRVNE